MNQNIAIAILAFWAVAATGVMIAALRSRNAAQRAATSATITAKVEKDSAERWRSVALELREKHEPAPRKPMKASNKPWPHLVRSSNPKPPKGPSGISRPSQSNDSTDALMLGTVASGWSSYDPSPSPSYDSGSTSSSSDSGSCGGGGE